MLLLKPNRHGHKPQINSKRDEGREISLTGPQFFSLPDQTIALSESTCIIEKASNGRRANKVVRGLTGKMFLVVIGRLTFAALLLFVQFYVLRAMIRFIRSLEIDQRKEKTLVALAIIFVVLVNLPLAAFIAESVFRPTQFALYSPPPEYEAMVKPFAYIFFIWTLSSLVFALVSPFAMAFFAAVQFFRRKRGSSKTETTVQVMDLSRRRFLRIALAAVATMPFAASAYGAVAARFRRVVERVVISIPGLPSQLDGLTIVQMSDIHSGLFMSEARMREYVEVANSLKPDIVALTGDFVSTKTREVYPFMRAVSSLEAKHGVYGCLGNHDDFDSAEQQLISGFKEAGFRLLINENHIIDIDGAKLNIIGVRYIGKSEAEQRLQDYLKGIDLDGTSILLCHTPYPFEKAAKMGIDLTLSGHTHGGQISLTLGDMILTPARAATVFIAGLFRIDNSHLYVNRGLGTSGPPIRINAPPEITHITLRTEES